MIKAILLDVDGVIVGSKKGINAPLPHPDVLKWLTLKQQSGITVSLITSKGFSGIRQIIKLAKLAGPHIYNGGSVLISGKDESVLNVELLDKVQTKSAIAELREKDVYVELYDLENYYVIKDLVSEFTDEHAFILESSPIFTDSIETIQEKAPVNKMIAMAFEEEQTKAIEDTLVKYDQLKLSWHNHPRVPKAKFGIITKAGVDKGTGIKAVSKVIKVKTKDMLGVGDSTSDWQFMQYCGQVAAMGNADEELKECVKKAGGKLLPSVDDNGILEI